MNANDEKRRPVFFKVPMGWAEMTEEEKYAFAESFARAVEKAAGLPVDEPGTAERSVDDQSTA